MRPQRTVPLFACKICAKAGEAFPAKELVAWQWGRRCSNFCGCAVGLSLYLNLTAGLVPTLSEAADITSQVLTPNPQEVDFKGFVACEALGPQFFFRNLN